MAKVCTVSRLERQFATLCLFHAPTRISPNHLFLAFRQEAKETHQECKNASSLPDAYIPKGVKGPSFTKNTRVIRVNLRNSP